MCQSLVSLFISIVCVLSFCVDISFASYVSPSEWLTCSTNKSSSSISTTSYDLTCKFSTELQKEGEKTVLWNIDDVEYQDENLNIYIMPTILKNQNNIFDDLNVETFYLPEPITIIFLVVGMFVLFRKRK